MKSEIEQFSATSFQKDDSRGEQLLRKPDSSRNISQVAADGVHYIKDDVSKVSTKAQQSLQNIQDAIAVDGTNRNKQDEIARLPAINAKVQQMQLNIRHFVEQQQPWLTSYMLNGAKFSSPNHNRL